MSLTYHVTGILTNGKRFKRMTFTRLSDAYSINLYRGTVWMVINGKRTKLREVYN